jgi:D-sedoheptulose 7-phosphate isomerase
MTHVDDLVTALQADPELSTVTERWGSRLAALLSAGGRLLTAGNGGSAAQAQHLTAELVGRYDRERRPFSALALHAETSSLTAILNDYGPEEVFARQVEAHGRRGDVCVLISTSGRSRNLIAAATRAREVGVQVWAMTGPEPNPLAELADERLCVAAARTCTIQEVHLVALHMICEALDAALAAHRHLQVVGK